MPLEFQDQIRTIVVAFEECQAEPESDDRDPIAGLNAWTEDDAGRPLDGDPLATRRGRNP